MAGVPSAGMAGPRPPVPSPTCRQVREYLDAMARGERSPAAPALWESLAPRNVLAGTRDRPEITTVGEQVLHELQVRAYRTDPRPIDAVAAEIGATVATLAGIADNAEYFVAELGPVPPVEVLPYLRVVAVSLACRPESAEDLVEEFKNAWGSMEVLGGTDADRLLAAELISASGVAQEAFYAPLTQTVDRLRSAGCRTALATAALLQLHPQMTSVLRVDPWVVARRKVGADEEAAMLATTFDLPEALRRWEAWRSALEGSETDRRRSAAYLTLEGEPTPARVNRIRETATLLKGMFDSPTLAAALATSHLAFAPTEVHDWLTKGVQVAASRQLAPTRPELAVLGLAMLRGLRLEGAASEVTGDLSEVRVRSEIGLPAHVALHAWLYRETRRSSPA